MTPEQFEIAASKTRLKPNTLAAVRRVLVDGIGKAEAGREYGLSRSFVKNSVMRIEQEYRWITGAPSGWVAVTVVLPLNSEEHLAVLEIEKRARALLSAEQ